MKITKIITAVDESETYIHFVPLMSLAWQKIANIKPTIGFITNRTEDDQLVKKIRKFGKVKLFKPMKSVHPGVQAKVTRMYLASNKEFINEACMITDIDMIPLTKDVITVFNKISDSHLAKWGYDHPAFAKGTSDFGKWPMDRTCASGKTFNEIINPVNLTYEQLLQSWFGFHAFGREDITLPFNLFSDESLLRALYEKWDKKDTNTSLISRLTLEEKMLSKRLDRSCPQQWENLYEKLKKNEFIEIHGVRPFLQYFHLYEEIIKYLEFDKKELIL